MRGQYALRISSRFCGGAGGGHRHGDIFMGSVDPGAVGLKFAGLGGTFTDEAQDHLRNECES